MEAPYIGMVGTSDVETAVVSVRLQKAEVSAVKGINAVEVSVGVGRSILVKGSITVSAPVVAVCETGTGFS